MVFYKAIDLNANRCQENFTRSDETPQTFELNKIKKKKYQVNFNKSHISNKGRLINNIYGLIDNFNRIYFFMDLVMNLIFILLLGLD